jgi:uncharacterized membrane protein YraQ (UPF0718 family)
VPAAEGRFTLWSGVGALLSLAGLLALSGALPAPGGAGAERGFGDAFLDIAVESAPWILLGFAAAGAFQALIPRVIFSWVQARGRMSQALRGIALGLPLPLCSCGVVPVYLSLLKKGVPPAAALAFLVATPEIGIDSVFLSSSLLGIEITLIRLTMAFLIALAVGLTLARTFEKIQKAGQIDQLALPPERPAPRNLEEKLREALRFGGREIVDHTGAWLLVGIALAAVLEPYVKAEWLSQIPRGVDVLLFSLVGLPLYVCASGATPLAAVLLHKGISTGAVLALLITGPSTNITTFGILKRYHGAKGALLFAGWVYAFSIAIGFAINFLFPRSSAPIRQLPPHELHGPGAWVCLGLVAVLFAGSLIRLGPRGFLATLGEGLAGPEALGGEPAPHGHPHDHHHEGDRHPAAADPAHAAGARSGRAAD